MLLSIVILSYKSKNLTRECIKGIFEFAKLDFEYEIIVVDNGSQDEVEQMLQTKYPEVKFIGLEKNIGMGAGNNAGIRQAKGKYIMILNPDVVVFEKTIRPLIAFLESHSQAGVVAPMIVNPDKTHQVSAHRFPSLMMPFYRRTILGRTKKGKEFLRNYSIQDISHSEPSKVDWIFGPSFVIRKDLANKLDGYDERFFLFLEDTDLCRRVWQAGYEVWYVPGAKAVHYPHRLSRNDLGLRSLLKKFTWYHIASWVKYFWKWRNSQE